MILIKWFFFLFLFSLKAWGQDAPGWCGTIFKSEKVGCQNLSNSNSSGGSYPLLFDAFNINPSSLPTFETPLGVEMFVEGGGANFAFIKGVDKLGTGLSSFSTDANFFSNVSNSDVMSAIAESGVILPSASERFDPKINYGNSLNIFGSDSDSFLSGNIGGNIKYNRVTGEMEKGLGLVLKTQHLNFSYSKTVEARGSVLASTTLGFRLGNFVYDFSHLANTSGVIVTTTIHSLTFGTKSFTFTAAHRNQQDPNITDEVVSALYDQGIIYSRNHYLVGANWRPNEHLRLGYYYNYILGEKNSLLIQYIF